MAAPYSGSPIKVTTKMVSYNTASLFQYVYGSGHVSKYQDFINTGAYRPNLNKVGSASEKIFIADGARWTNGDTSPPDYNLGFDNSADSPGGHYADYGPWSAYSRAYLRNKPMALAMRHGDRNPGGVLGGYRFNAAFFDGHVETLDGSGGMNPQLWMPRGTLLRAIEATTEAKSLYFNGQSTLQIN